MRRTDMRCCALYERQEQSLGARRVREQQREHGVLGRTPRAVGRRRGAELAKEREEGGRLVAAQLELAQDGGDGQHRPLFAGRTGRAGHDVGGGRREAGQAADHAFTAARQEQEVGERMDGRMP